VDEFRTQHRFFAPASPYGFVSTCGPNPTPRSILFSPSPPPVPPSTPGSSRGVNSFFSDDAPQFTCKIGQGDSLWSHSFSDFNPPLFFLLNDLFGHILLLSLLFDKDLASGNCFRILGWKQPDQPPPSLFATQHQRPSSPASPPNPISAQFPSFPPQSPFPLSPARRFSSGKPTHPAPDGRQPDAR